MTKTEKKPKKESVSKADLDALRAEMKSDLQKMFDDFVIEAASVVSSSDDEDEPANVQHESKGRYIIAAGGQTYVASEFKPNKLYGLDFYFQETIDGKEYNSKGTIMSNDITIIDLEPEMTLEVFTAIKKQTIDYIVHQAEEAKAQEEVLKKMQEDQIASSDASQNNFYI